MTSDSTTMVMGHVEGQTEMASLLRSNEWRMVQITIIDSIATTTQWEVEVEHEAFVEAAAVACSIMATYVEELELDLEALQVVEAAEVS